MDPKSPITIDPQVRKGRAINTPLLIVFIIVILVGSFAFTFMILDNVINPVDPGCKDLPGRYGMYANTCPEESGLFPERYTGNAFAALPISLFISFLLVFFVQKASSDSTASNNISLLKSSLKTILYVIVGSIIFILVVGEIGSLLT